MYPRKWDVLSSAFAVFSRETPASSLQPLYIRFTFTDAAPGGEGGTRTLDLLYAIQTRYQLRHIPKCLFLRVRPTFRFALTVPDETDKHTPWR